MKAAARGQKLKLYFYNVYISGAASTNGRNQAPLKAFENQCSPNPGPDIPEWAAAAAAAAAGGDWQAAGEQSSTR